MHDTWMHIDSHMLSPMGFDFSATITLVSDGMHLFPQAIYILL